MDPVSKTLIRSDISTPPEINSELEDAEDEDDGSGDWEDFDDDGEGDEQNIVGFVESDISINAKNARDFTFLRWWQHAIVHERRGAVNPLAEAEKNRPVADRYSPESLFADRPSATMILLKVLKHSISDLQRDFRLARAVLLLIADWGLCDEIEEETQEGREMSGLECLRRLLTIISSEYAVRNCGGYCHEWYIACSKPLLH